MPDKVSLGRGEMLERDEDEHVCTSSPTERGPRGGRAGAGGDRRGPANRRCMTTQRTTSDRPDDVIPVAWRRVLALSGIAFPVLFVVGFFLTGADTPDYAAADQEWTKWADDGEASNGIAAFLCVLAGFAFLYFLGIIRSVLGAAEASVRGSAQLARVAFAGGLAGIVGIVTAIVMIAAATFEGADSNPVVSRAVTTASAGPFVIASMGFSAMLAAAGLVTLRSRIFARWIGILALVGAVGFLITFLTMLDGSSDSAFGVGYPIGLLALMIWSIVTSVDIYRKLGSATLIASK